jgi:hypothetical protein
MTTTLNATTSNGLVVTPDNSGNVLLQYNGVAAPAFSAYQSTTQSVNSGTITKVQLQTEEFDTANAFDSTTNYRFTPQVAGYYQVNGNIGWNITSGQSVISIYKNGSRFKDGSFNTGGTDGTQSVVSTLIYLNGTTDYIEMYCYQNTGSAKNTGTGATSTFFQACLLRGA